MDALFACFELVSTAPTERKSTVVKAPMVSVILIPLLLSLSSTSSAQWVFQSMSFPSTNAQVEAIFAVDTSVVWGLAFENMNRFTRTTNGGAVWVDDTISGTAGLVNGAITAVDGRTAWVTMHDPSFTTSGGVFKTTDGGGTWVKQGTAFPGLGGVAQFIHFFDADTGLVVGYRNNSIWEIYTSTNGGSTWTLVPSANIPLMIAGETLGFSHEHTVLGNTFWFGTTDGRVYKSTDRGHHWTAAVVGPSQHNVHSIAFQDDSVGLATYYVGSFPTTYKTTNGGRSWFPIDPPLVPRPHVLTHVPGTTGVYMICGHLLGGDITGSAYTLNGGLCWTTVDNLSHLTPVFVTPTVGWASGITESGVRGMFRWTGTALVPPATARLLICQSAVDLGNIELGHSSDTSVVSLYNAGMSPLSISSILQLQRQASYQVLAYPKAPTVLQQGASVVLKIVFTPTGQGVVNDTIVIVSDDPLSPISRIALTGKTYSIAQAQTGVLYAVTDGADSSRLASVNTSSGVATSIGKTGYAPIVSVAVHPATREIIGLVATGTSSSALVRINSTGGDAHPLSAISIPNPKGMTFGQDGMLYVGTFNARVYSMNYVTGAAIETVLTNPPIRISGLTSNRAGELWACIRPSSGPLDGIYTINFSTGKTILVGYTGLGGRLLDILFYKGVLYGITDSTGSNRNRLIQINTATGAGTVIGPTGFSSVQALAALPDNVTSVYEIITGAQPMENELEQNYPNPFNPSTRISFSVPIAVFVSLKVYDLLGREVSTLVGEALTPGRYEVTFDGAGLASGVYFYHLQAGQSVQTKKLLLQK
jgi:photosystem II stability/assembly factor-like uncharacterized protein